MPGTLLFCASRAPGRCIKRHLSQTGHALLPRLNQRPSCNGPPHQASQDSHPPRHHARELPSSSHHPAHPSFPYSSPEHALGGAAETSAPPTTATGATAATPPPPRAALATSVLNFLTIAERPLTRPWPLHNFKLITAVNELLERPWRQEVAESSEQGPLQAARGGKTSVPAQSLAQYLKHLLFRC